MLQLTVVLLIVLLMISFIIFDRDLFAPPTVVSLGLLFATLCCMYNEKKWQLDFSINTTWTIVAGVAAFMGGGVLALIFSSFSRGGHGAFSKSVSEVKQINVATIKTVLVLLFEFATMVFLFVELKKITGCEKWSQVVSTFRDQTALVSPDKYTMRLPGICTLCIDVCFAFALLYAYIVGNNIAAKAKINVLNWIPIICSSALAFMQGYRSDMLRLWIAILVVTYTLKKRKSGWKHTKETKKMIRTMALSVVGIAAAFVALRGTVGRAETDWDPIYYLAFYAGSPIAALDLFLKEPLPVSEIWGKETFYHLNQSLGAWFHKPDLIYIFYKEYRKSPSGIYIGNVYTALRPPYNDFGFGGMIIVLLIMGMFFTLFYCKIRDRKGESPIDMRLLIYSYVAYTFFMYFYNCYNSFISFGFIRLVLELIVLRLFLVGWSSKKPFVIKIGSK